MLPKLRSSTYKAWWDLHAWAGVISSLIAYVMFFFGGWTLLRPELQEWQESRGPVPSFAEVDRVLDASIQGGAVSPKSIRVFLPGPSSARFSLLYTDSRGEPRYDFIERAKLVEPRSNAADFLYTMHYLQPPSAPEWLYVAAGAAAGLLLLIVISGVLIHLRQLLPQLHQLRPRKTLQVLWSDSHKVLGTLGVPFVAVYALTGAWMGLESVMGPALARYTFAGDGVAAAVAQNGPRPPAVQPAHLPAARLPLATLLAKAHEQPPPPGVPREKIAHCRAVFLNDMGDREATAHFYCGPISVLLHQRDGSAVPVPRAPPTLVSRIYEVPYALHFVEFGRLPLRVLYALLTLAGCGAILTGNWLWLERRTANRGTWFVQRATLATVAGSLVATAGLLAATRLAISPSFERQVFWCSWLLMSSVCFVPGNARTLWRAAFGVAGALFVVIPLLSVARAGTEAWRALPAGIRAVDLAFLALGVLCLSLASGWKRLVAPRGRTSANWQGTSDVA